MVAASPQQAVIPPTELAAVSAPDPAVQGAALAAVCLPEPVLPPSELAAVESPTVTWGTDGADEPTSNAFAATADPFGDGDVPADAFPSEVPIAENTWGDGLATSFDEPTAVTPAH